MSTELPPRPSGLVCLLGLLFSLEDSQHCKDWLGKGRSGVLAIIVGSDSLSENGLPLKAGVG